MATRYEHEGNDTVNLMRLSSIWMTEDHFPEHYSYWVDINEKARWGQVFCSCGSSMRSVWAEETPSYLEMLQDAWTQLENHAVI